MYIHLDLCHKFFNSMIQSTVKSHVFNGFSNISVGCVLYYSRLNSKSLSSSPHVKFTILAAATTATALAVADAADQHAHTPIALRNHHQLMMMIILASFQCLQHFFFCHGMHTLYKRVSLFIGCVHMCVCVCVSQYFDIVYKI